MSESKLKVYANDQLLIIDWTYSDPIPEGMLITLNDQAVPKPIQGMVIVEKSRYMLAALLPGVNELAKVRLEIRSKDASLIDSFSSKGKLKPILEKDFQDYPADAGIKILRGLLRKLPLTFKGIKNEVLRNLCKQLAIDLTTWKVGEEIHFQLPCALSGKQQPGEREVLVWRLVDGSSDAYDKITAYWQNDICYAFVPESFIVESGNAVYVIEDAESFAIPMHLSKPKKLPKGLTLADSHSLHGVISKPLKSFLDRPVKKKHLEKSKAVK